MNRWEREERSFICSLASRACALLVHVSFLLFFFVSLHNLSLAPYKASGLPLSKNVLYFQKKSGVFEQHVTEMEGSSKDPDKERITR